eukprot:3932333-Rhodomonas_salina.2
MLRADDGGCLVERVTLVIHASATVFLVVRPRWLMSMSSANAMLLSVLNASADFMVSLRRFQSLPSTLLVLDLFADHQT